MRYTFTITETLLERLMAAVFEVAGREGAGYVLCGVSSTDSETRLLARDVIPVQADHYRVRDADRLSIVCDSYVPIAKHAAACRRGDPFRPFAPQGVP